MAGIGLTPEQQALIDRYRSEQKQTPVSDLDLWTGKTQQAAGGSSFLSKIMTPFTWWHEHVDKPWAAILASGATPEAPETKGLPWLQRQMKEYEAWKSPWGVKGALETFANPVNYIPVGGAVKLGAKGLETAGVGGNIVSKIAKLGQGISKVENLPGEMITGAAKPVFKMVTPTAETIGKKLPGVSKLASEFSKTGALKEAGKTGSSTATEAIRLMNQEVENGIFSNKYVGIPRPLETVVTSEFTQDEARKVSEKLATNKVLKRLIDFANPSATANTDLAKMTMAEARREVAAESLSTTATAVARQVDAQKLFGYAADKICTAVKPKPGYEGASLAIADVLAFPTHYDLTPEQLAYANLVGKLVKEAETPLDRAGIAIKRRPLEADEQYIPRYTTARRVAKYADGTVAKLGQDEAVPIGAKEEWLSAKGSPLDKPRIYKTQLEGIRAGEQYMEPIDAIQEMIEQRLVKLSRAEYAEHVDAMARAGGLSLTAAERIETLPGLEEFRGLGAARKVSSQKALALRKIRRDISDAMASKKLSGATLKQIDETLPEVGAQLRKLLVVPKSSLEKAVLGISDDVWKQVEKDVAETVRNAEVAAGKTITEAANVILTRDSFMEVIAKAQAERGVKGNIKNISIADMANAMRNVGIKDETAVALMDDIYKQIGDAKVLLKESVKAGRQAAKEQLKGAMKTETQATKEATRAKVASLSELRDQVDELYKATRKSTTAIKAKYKRGMELAGQPLSVTEKKVLHGNFNGKIYPIDMAQTIEKLFASKDVDKWLRTLETGVAVPRTLMSGMDFGVTQIHLLPMAFRHPLEWAKTIKMEFAAFKDSKSVWRYLEANREMVQEMNRYGIKVAGQPAEMVAALGPGGVLGKVPMMSRWESSFTGALAAGQVETWKALRKLALNADGLLDDKLANDVAAFVRNSTGTLDSRLLGVPAGQRAAESVFLAFAPRYTRSIFALWSSALTNPTMRAEVLKTLGALFAGATATYVAVCKAMGQEPQLNPTRSGFMTVRIGGTNVGIGSGQIAMLKFMANVANTAATSPEDFLKFNPKELETWQDNPFAQFARSRTSVLTGTGIDLLTGRTYIGEPLDSVPDILREEVVGQTLPFWMQSYVTDTPKPGIAQVPAEMFGMKSYSEAYYQARDEKRDAYALQDTGEKWDSLTKLQQDAVVNAHADLADVTQKAEDRAAEFGGVDRQVWHDYKEQIARVNDFVAEELATADKAVQDGKISLKDFRYKVDEIFSQSRAMKKLINENDKYKVVQDYFAKPLDTSDMQLEDIAFSEYMNETNDPALTDEYGIYNYDEAQARKEAVRTKYGDAVYQYIQDRLDKGSDESPTMKLLRWARETLKPYWDVEKQVWSQYPTTLKATADKIKLLESTDETAANRLLYQNPAIVVIRKRIALLKKQIKLRDADIAAALQMFYT